MARMTCPDCPRTFKGQSGLAWHRDRSHPTGSSVADGTALAALVGQKHPVISSAGPDPALVIELKQKISNLERKLASADGLSEDMHEWLVEAEQERDALRKAKVEWEEEKAAFLSRIESLRQDNRDMGRESAKRRLDEVAAAQVAAMQRPPAVSQAVLAAEMRRGSNPRPPTAFRIVR